jgi:hypothetical protein
MYIPSAPKVTNGTDEEKKALKRWYRHLSIAFFVKLFDQWASEPFSITFKSKKNHLVTKTVWFVVRVFTGLMDHPGAQVNAGYKSSARAKCPCRRCLVVHADIYETDCGIIGSMECVTMRWKMICAAFIGTLYLPSQWFLNRSQY